MQKTPHSIKQSIAIVTLFAFVLFVSGSFICMEAFYKTSEYPACCLVLLDEGCSPCCDADVEACCFPAIVVAEAENNGDERHYIVGVLYAQPLYVDKICMSIFKPPKV